MRARTATPPFTATLATMLVRPRMTVSLLHPSAAFQLFMVSSPEIKRLGGFPRTRRVPLLSTLHVLSHRRTFASAGGARRAAICRPRLGPGSGEGGLRTGVRGGGPRGGAPEAVPLAVLEG